MNRELKFGMWVRLHTPERGYWCAELVEEFWPYWLVRLPSGYEFPVYPDEFDVAGKALPSGKAGAIFGISCFMGSMYITRKLGG